MEVSLLGDNANQRHYKMRIGALQMRRVALLTTPPSDSSPQLEVLFSKEKYSCQETCEIAGHFGFLVAGSRSRRGITNMAGVIDPDQQEEGGLHGGREE